jgi:hypothetical protein
MRRLTLTSIWLNEPVKPTSALIPSESVRLSGKLVHPDVRRDGSLTFKLAMEDGGWSVQDVVFQPDTTAEAELLHFREKNPNAIEVPANSQ